MLFGIIVAFFYLVTLAASFPQFDSYQYYESRHAQGEWTDLHVEWIKECGRRCNAQVEIDKAKILRIFPIDLKAHECVLKCVNEKGITVKFYLA
ncbi:UNVERIFIED_CONTAM: hypothetical protein RMT77_014433 [Armadillidium vulgare]